jgi:cellulose synthase/poly-beta-1,6-N-acetylglucosamine synthase-like glycosyltransferase
MANMMFYVVVPLSRPQNIQNVLNNFNNQIYSDKKLVIVENGNAIGTCNKLNIKPDILLKSDKHQSIAKNTALNYLKQIAFNDYWVNMDDDDWYGPDYLNEIYENISHGDVIGKHYHYVEFDSGFYLFNENNHNKLTTKLHGATLCSNIFKAVEFPIVIQGEDHIWCEIMKNKGYLLYATSSKNYIYNRKNIETNHAWVATEVSARMTFGVGKYLGKEINNKNGLVINFPSDEEIFRDMKNMATLMLGNI